MSLTSTQSTAAVCRNPPDIPHALLASSWNVWPDTAELEREGNVSWNAEINEFWRENFGPDEHGKVEWAYVEAR